MCALGGSGAHVLASRETTGPPTTIGA
jgi:hypothetical protein